MPSLNTHDIVEETPFTRPVDDPKRRSVRGGLVTLISQSLKFVVRTGSMMILARLLSPEDFGLQGMVVAMTGFLGLFRDAGLSTVTVQREMVSHEQVSTLFWINVGIGALLSLALVVASPAIAAFYKEPRLNVIAVVSASAFLINGLSVQHYALLQRQMRFLALATIEMMSLILSGLVGVGMALLGYEYWSLVAMTIVSPAVTAFGSWVAIPWSPGLPRRGCGLRSLLSFGGILTCNSLVVYLAYNTEKILLGHYWGAQALGLYGRAFQLISLPSEQFNSAFSAVAYPFLSRLQNDVDRMRRAFLRGYSLVLSLTIPTTITCAVFADQIVQIMLGPEWSEVVPIFRLMTPTILARALINPFAWFLISSGRVRRSLHLAFLIAPMAILAAVLGVRFGPTGVALAFSTAMTLLVVPIIVWAKAGTPLTGRDIWTAVRSPLVSGLVAATAAYGLETVLATALPTLLQVVLGTGLVFTVYFMVLFYPMGQRDTYVALFNELRRPAAQAAH